MNAFTDVFDARKVFDSSDRVYFTPTHLEPNDIVVVEAMISRYVPRVVGPDGVTKVYATGTWRA